MQLVINTYGSYLQKNGDCFKVKVDEKVAEISCKKVSSILISTAAYITTDAIKMAMENNVEKACIIAGLDPYVGFIHTDHYNKKSLVFDLIENYRIWADEVVVNLFASRKVKVEHFDKIPNGLTLNKEGKAVLLTDFNVFMDESIRYRGRNIKRNSIIQFDCHRIANNLIGNNDETR